MLTNKLNIIFAGTPEFAAVGLQALIQSHHIIKAVYTQPDRPAGRGRKVTASAVKHLAMQHDLPVYQPLNLREPREQAFLKDLQADVMIVIAYGLILPLPILTAPRWGCLNVHASLLPKWRGAAPIQRAILAGDHETGVTIMQMNEGLDTGDMLIKKFLPIGLKDTSEILHNRLAVLGAEALLQTLEELVTHALKPEKQDDAQATYAHKIAKDEAAIDWELSAIKIDRKVRAFNPWPIAQTLMGDQMLRIWQSEPLAEQHHSGNGTIIQADDKGFDVATGDGILRLQEIQFPGGRAMSVRDVLNSRGAELFLGRALG